MASKEATIYSTVAYRKSNHLFNRANKKDTAIATIDSK